MMISQIAKMKMNTTLKEKTPPHGLKRIYSAQNYGMRQANWHTYTLPHKIASYHVASLRTLGLLLESLRVYGNGKESMNAI